MTSQQLSSLTISLANNVEQDKLLTIPLVNSTLNGPVMICSGLKNQTGVNGWTVAYVHDTTYTTSGIMRRLWIATAGSVSPGQIYIQIITDGVTAWGNSNLTSSVDGINNIGLALDLLLTPAGSGTLTFACDKIGCNTFSPSGGFGGYITIDVPFTTSFEILLGTAQTTGYNYWIQPFIEEYPPIVMDIVPYKCYCITSKWSNTTYNYEYPFFDFQGAGNGVHLLGIKVYIFGLSGNWWEGRFRAYTSTNGFGQTAIPATGWTSNFTVSNIPTGMSGGRVILQSTGTEDFFLSSHNWTTAANTYNGVYSTSISGCAYQSNGNTGVISTSSISVYRFFDCDVIYSLGYNYLTLTWTSGDPQVGQSGSVTIFCQCWFMA